MGAIFEVFGWICCECVAVHQLGIALVSPLFWCVIALLHLVVGQMGVQHSPLLLAFVPLSSVVHSPQGHPWCPILPELVLPGGSLLGQWGAWDQSGFESYLVPLPGQFVSLLWPTLLCVWTYVVVVWWVLVFWVVVGQLVAWVVIGVAYGFLRFGVRNTSFVIVPQLLLLCWH